MAAPRRMVELALSDESIAELTLRPLSVHDPMTMLLRENVVRDNLVRWDRRERSLSVDGYRPPANWPGQPCPGAVVSFRNRSVVGSGVLHGKSSNSSLRE